MHCTPVALELKITQKKVAPHPPCEGTKNVERSREKRFSSWKRPYVALQVALRGGHVRD